MNPTEIKERLAAYADGELTAAERAAVEIYLRDHPEDRVVVRRWQALRDSARRAVCSEPLPDGLAERVRTRLATPSRRHSARWYRVGASGLAAAAVLVFAVLLWPRGAQATSVQVSGFAAVHRRCALERRHLSVTQPDSQTTLSVEALSAREPLARRLPDLTAHGYRLEGVCRCGPPECCGCGARVLHAYFRPAAVEGAVVSAFVIDRSVQLCASDGSACSQCRRGGRCFRCGTDGDISVVGWSDGRISYLLAAQMPRHDLTRLAESVHVGAVWSSE